MPKVNKKILIFTAGFIWAVGGFMLLRKGILLSDKISSSIFLILLVLGIAIGLTKMYFVFRKVIARNVVRINAYKKGKVCFFAFQKWKFYVLISLMVGLGIFMSKTNYVSHEVIFVVDIAVGTGLFSASIFYFKAFFQKNIS